MTRRSSPRRSRYSNSGFTEPSVDADAARGLVELGMAVRLVIGGIEEGAALSRTRGYDGRAGNDPQAYDIAPTGIHVASVLQRHLRVGCVYAARMLVWSALLLLSQHLPERPLAARSIRLIGACRHLPMAQAALAAPARRCFSAYAAAASRTQPPLSWAARRAARRSRLQGPFPPMTCLNSAQSISPNSQCLVSAL